jgi:flagellar biosynthesis/type III secretory pathway protein FliH
MEEAYRRGFREGEAAGVAMALEELEPARAALGKATEGLACLQESLERQHQENLFALALAVARQVVGREVETDPKIVADLVRTALSHFPLDQRVKVRLNPADLSALSGETSAETAPLTAGRDVRWIPDESVTRGGCIVEGPEHVVDGRLDTALERIYRKVFDGR